MELTPVINGFILFLLFILLPLFPSIIIYAIFPKTEVAVSGPFKGLTLNTSGAFAAYFVVLLAGAPMANEVKKIIKDDPSTRIAWTVEANIEFLESDSTANTSISDEDVEKLLRIVSNPDHNQMTLNSVQFVTHKTGERFPFVTFTFENHKSETIDLNDLSKVEVDNDTKIIRIDNIKLIQTGQPYTPPSNVAGLQPTTTTIEFVGGPTHSHGPITSSNVSNDDSQINQIPDSDTNN